MDLKIKETGEVKSIVILNWDTGVDVFPEVSDMVNREYDEDEDGLMIVPLEDYNNEVNYFLEEMGYNEDEDEDDDENDEWENYRLLTSWDGHFGELKRPGETE